MGKKVIILAVAAALVVVLYLGTRSASAAAGAGGAPPVKGTPPLGSPSPGDSFGVAQQASIIANQVNAVGNEVFSALGQVQAAARFQTDVANGDTVDRQSAVLAYARAGGDYKAWTLLPAEVTRLAAAGFDVTGTHETADLRGYSAPLDGVSADDPLVSYYLTGANS